MFNSGDLVKIKDIWIWGSSPRKAIPSDDCYKLINRIGEIAQLGSIWPIEGVEERCYEIILPIYTDRHHGVGLPRWTLPESYLEQVFIC